MLHREPEYSGLIEVCDRLGVALLPFYPLASGLLTGTTRRGKAPKGRLQMDRYRKFLTDENFDFIERLDAFARSRGVTMAQVALGWLLVQQSVPSVTPGASTPRQVEANAKAVEWQPSAADLAALETLAGGGGPTAG